jgi:phosphatase NudJ
MLIIHVMSRPTLQVTRFKPSVTVAGIIEHAGKYLLVEEHTADGLRLNNPAGHVDPAESPEAACVREVLEETARHFTPTALLGVYLSRFQRPATRTRPFEDVTYVRFAFCGAVGEQIAGRALDDGIVRTLWLTPSEIQACADRHRSPLVWRCIDDHMRGIRLPLSSIYTDASVASLG